MTIKTPRLACAALAITLLATPAFAVNKDMVQLQTQVQQLQDAVARLQQSNDERMGVMKDLVQQTADSVNKMSAAVDTLQKQMAAQQDAQNAKIDQVSGQIQSFNDSLDELKARLGRIEKALADIQSRQQSMEANLQGGSPSAAGVPPSSGLPSAQDTSAPTGDAPPASAPVVRGKPSALVPLSEAANGTAPSAPPVEDLYKTALGDYMGARYALATSEFSDVVKFYPDNNLAGNAFFYLGEIDYRAAKYTSATKNYDKLLAQYPANPKVPAAHLHKGEALIALKQNDAGVRELRQLIQRFPNAPEAMQARSKLSGMGIPVTPRR
jgi:tol-pal system protein YbgF